MLPPKRRGGAVECTPGSGGGMPITPRNGARVTVTPRSSVAVPPSSVHWNGLPSPNVTPHGPGVTSSIATTSVWPARAPRTSIGPFNACPSWSSRSRSKRSASGSQRQPALSDWKRTLSPGSTLSTGGSAEEK